SAPAHQRLSPRLWAERRRPRRTSILEFPKPDAASAQTLGDALREVGYSESSVHELLGEDASGGAEEDAAPHERRLPQTRVATVIRLLFLQRAVPRRAAVEALGERGVDALETT